MRRAPGFDADIQFCEEALSQGPSLIILQRTIQSLVVSELLEVTQLIEGDPILGHTLSPTALYPSEEEKAWQYILYIWLSGISALRNWGYRSKLGSLLIIHPSSQGSGFTQSGHQALETKLGPRDGLTTLTYLKEDQNKKRLEVIDGLRPRPEVRGWKIHHCEIQHNKNEDFINKKIVNQYGVKKRVKCLGQL